jgi:hypothetical protein
VSVFFFQKLPEVFDYPLSYLGVEGFPFLRQRALRFLENSKTTPSASNALKIRAEEVM